jgi:putative ABC transport system permease protein
MPDWRKYLKENLTLPVMAGHRDERAIQEMADHLEDLYREARSRGATEEDAEAHVLGWVGDPRRAASELLDAEPHHVRARVDRWFERREEEMASRGGARAFLADGLRDLRIGLRGLAKRPVFSGVVILVLALGIGATTAIFTLVNGILLSPLPFADQDRLVVLSHSRPDRGEGDVGQCAAWHFTYEEENRVFQELGMYVFTTAAVTGDGEPEALPVLQTTSGVFRALGLTPAAGRMFTPADEDPDTPTLVMLGHGYWQRRYGGDPGVVGQTLVVDGVTREIVGVAPPTLSALGTDPDLVYLLRHRRADLFVGNVGYSSVALLRKGVTRDRAVADMERMLPLAFEKFPGGPVARAATGATVVPAVTPLKDALVGSAGRLLWVLLAGVGVVLLIACANVANLFLVRADGKSTEMAVRTAMGASRARVGWEYMKESLILGFLGGGAGLGMAWAGLRALATWGPAQLPRMEQVALDPWVVLFTLALALGAGVAFGMIPMLRLGTGSLTHALKEGGRSGLKGGRRQRAQDLLAVGQVALALVLLVGAGLLLRSGRALGRVDTGVRAPEDLFAVGLNFASRVIPDAGEAALAQEAVARRLEEIPGVSSVAMATEIPVHRGGNINPLYVEGITDPSVAPAQTRRHKWIGEGYFETMGTRILAGRTFTWQDIHDRIPAVVVSEGLAREYWGGVEAALGKRVSVRPDPVRWNEVVGVVADVREDGVDQDPPLMVYWPQVTLAFWEGSAPDQVTVWRYAGYALRTDRMSTPGFLKEVREAIWSVNPNLPLMSAGPLSDFMARSVARRTFALRLLTLAALAALLLGTVGVYGVLSYGVSQRSREMGMRLALGAGRGDVVRMVVRHGAALAGAGIVLGLVLALGFTRLMTSLLFGVSPADPATMAIVAGGLLGVALTASYLPARKAARVDPMVAVRSE